MLFISYSFVLFNKLILRISNQILGIYLKNTNIMESISDCNRYPFLPLIKHEMCYEMEHNVYILS